MGSALTDEAAIDSSNPAARPYSASIQAARSSSSHTSVVRLLDGDALRDHRRVQQRRTRSERSPAAPVTVLTVDPQLGDLIRNALPPEHRVFTAATLEEAEEFAATDRCAILITDQTVVRDELDRITGILRTHEPSLVTVAIGDRTQDEALVDLLAGGAVDRFMVRPLESESTRLVIESAAREHHNLKAKSRFAVAEPLRNGASQPDDNPLRVTAPFRRTNREPLTTPEPAPVSQDRPSALTANSAPADTRHVGVPVEADHASQPGPAEDLTRIYRPAHETMERMADAGAPVAPDDSHPAGRDLPIAQSRWLRVIVAIVVTASIAAYFSFRHSPGVDLQEIIARNLSEAQAAYDQGRYVDPPESSALQSYRMVLALDPENAKAKAGLDRIASRLAADTRELIREQRLTQAVETLQRLRRVRPDHPELAVLDGQLRQAVQSRLVEQARVAAVSAPAAVQTVGNERGTPRSEPRVKSSANPQSSRPEEPRERAETNVPGDAPPAAEPAQPGYNWLALVLERTEQDRLLAPNGDSALHYFELLKQSGSVPERERAIAALGARLTGNAQIAISRQDLGLADRLLGQAKQVGYVGEDLAAAQTALGDARTALAVPQAAPGERTLANFVPPEYPHEALKLGMEGWIDVRLEVNPDGDVVQATVEDGKRRQLFGRAALVAARQWKYAPRANGTSVDTVKARVQFKLKD